MKKFISFCFILFLSSAAAFAQNEKPQELSALLGGMVKSDRWIIRKDKAEEEFIGNVRYENENYKISADRALSQRSLNAYTLSGNVYAQRTQDGQSVSLQASKVFFSRKRDAGYAQGSKKKQIKASFSNPNNTFNLYADRVDFSNKFSLFQAEGDCELSDINNTLYSGKMTFDVPSGVFTATERRPTLFGFNDDGDYALQADVITADNKNGVYKASGGVRGWITPAEDITKYTQGQKDGTQIF